MSDSANESAGAARRGRPPRINREGIVKAARTLPLETVTMQAVADVLGVDRKALSYHVSDLRGLRELVAFDVFESELSRVELPTGGDWREVIRLYTRATRDAVIEVGALAMYVRLSGASGVRALEPIERVVQALVDAGFGVDESGRILALLTEVAYSTGRDTLKGGKSDAHPDTHDVARTLTGAPENEFPVLRALVGARQSASTDDGQLEFDLAVIIAGLERRLESIPPPG
ncbi:TetR/AcrR family transcriptional regulator C-terminal domain-containing protein [Williamsia sp.]|uniref:TetR/AcrR family transcriptional regulator C-terminal domain-containing protein n=1 Tax=Williamsia sp. TaxID=1872085 RepID=UPI002F95A284